MQIRTVLSTLIFALALSFASVGTTLAATPDLMGRVNEALQMAGLPVNAQTQQSFAAGVASGHYTTFEQLVNAMKWHKAHGKTLANTGAFKPMQKVWAFTGTVTEINNARIELFGTNKDGVEVWPKFKITKWTKIKNGVLLLNASDEIRMEVKDEIRRGSVVTVWATSSGEALVIKNNAPWGQGDFYGPVDCPSCAGSNEFKATPDAVEQEDCEW